MAEGGEISCFTSLRRIAKNDFKTSTVKQQQLLPARTLLSIVNPSIPIYLLEFTCHRPSKNHGIAQHLRQHCAARPHEEAPRVLSGTRVGRGGSSHQPTPLESNRPLTDSLCPSLNDHDSVYAAPPSNPSILSPSSTQHHTTAARGAPTHGSPNPNTAPRARLHHPL